jgi:hypothetical protein
LLALLGVAVSYNSSIHTIKKWHNRWDCWNWTLFLVLCTSDDDIFLQKRIQEIWKLTVLTAVLLAVKVWWDSTLLPLHTSLHDNYDSTGQLIHPFTTGYLTHTLIIYA